MKTQVLADKKDSRIICTAFAVGKKHDFKLFCESKTGFAESTCVKTDTGYPGIMNLHDNSELRKKIKIPFAVKRTNARKTGLSHAREWQMHTLPALSNDSESTLNVIVTDGNVSVCASTLSPLFVIPPPL